MVSAKTIARRRVRAENRLVRAEARYINRALKHRHEHKKYSYAKVVEHLASAAQRRTESFEGDFGSTHRPLGDRFVIYKARVSKITPPKPTGIPKRFRKRLSSSSYMERTAWKSSRGHKIHMRLHQRKHKGIHPKDWRFRKGVVIPR